MGHDGSTAEKFKWSEPAADSEWECEQTQELPAVYCEPSWSERAMQRLRAQVSEYRSWHLQHFGTELVAQKHVSPEEIHHEKDRMLSEMQEEIDDLREIIFEAKEQAEKFLEPCRGGVDLKYALNEVIKILAIDG